MTFAPSVLILALLAASAARAETSALDGLTLSRIEAARPAAQSADARALAAASYAQTGATGAVTMPTAVDQHITATRFVASMGFLCGLQPSLNNTGSQAAFGYDPHGRFLGAKLSYAFK